MKIEIIGTSCSGKTTLARMLSEKYNVPYFQKDNFVWVRDPKGDKLRPDDERDAMYVQCINQADWIVEGVFRDFLNDGMPICDYIIILEKNFFVRLIRLFRRWIRRRRGLEAYDAYDAAPTLSYLLYCINWMLREPFTKKDMNNMLSAYKEKTFAFHDNYEAFQFIVSKYSSQN